LSLPPFYIVKPLNDDTTTGLLAPVWTAGAATFALLIAVADKPAAAPVKTNFLRLILFVIVAISLTLAGCRIIGSNVPVRKQAHRQLLACDVLE